MSEEFQAECPHCGLLGFEDSDDYFYHVSTCQEGEEDFLAGVTCNPDAPEECESCQ